MADQKILLGNVRGEQGPAGPNTVSSSTTTSGFENGHVLYNNNGKVGAKKLNASDVGARADNWMPTAAQVGILACSAQIDTATSIKISSETKVPLKINKQTASAGFTVSSGAIVAPKNGLALVAFQLMIEDGAANEYVGALVKKNGTVLADYYASFGEKGYGCMASMPRLVDLSKGDKIELFGRTSATNVTIANNTRTGVFIQYI